MFCILFSVPRLDNRYCEAKPQLRGEDGQNSKLSILITRRGQDRISMQEKDRGSLFCKNNWSSDAYLNLFK